MYGRTPLIGLCVSLTFFLAAASLAQAPPVSTGSDRALRELLDEVRLLRQVLQATSVGTLRAQILLGERQAHVERATQIDRQVTAIRAEQADAEGRMTRLNSDSAEFDRVLTSESDPDHRAAYEAHVRALAAEKDQTYKRQQMLQEREQELLATLSTEQAEVETIGKELSQIESDLAAVQQKSIERR